MCEIVGFSKFPHFSRIKLGTIVTQEGGRNSMYRKEKIARKAVTTLVEVVDANFLTSRIIICNYKIGSVLKYK